MTASVYVAIAVALLDAYIGARYCLKLFRKEIYPRIATWLIFEIGVVMSMAAYYASNDHSLIKASLNAADCLVVTVILIALLIEQHGRGISFTRNEQLSLALAGLAAVVWIFTRTGWIGFIGFQLVMSIAYIPMVESMVRWKPGPSPEPLEKWGINAGIAFLGVVVDVTGRHDYLAMVYPLRAFILCVLTVVLILRWNAKSRAAA